MRTRTIKPELFKDEKLGFADPLYTYIYVGLWMLADREGRLEDRPRRIHIEINCFRDPKGTEAALNWLIDNGFVARYEVGNERYLYIPTFHEDQIPNRTEPPSDIPPPPGVTNRYVHRAITPAQRSRILRRDRICQNCGSSQRPEIDHIVPIAAGGTSDDQNLQVLCRPCNGRKGRRVQ